MRNEIFAVFFAFLIGLLVGFIPYTLHVDAERKAEFDRTLHQAESMIKDLQEWQKASGVTLDLRNPWAKP